MSDDLTQKLPGDKEAIAPQDDDRISLLVIAVQSLSSSVQSLSSEVQSLRSEVHDVRARLETLEKTVLEHSFETKPIWERALAEIAATRAELAETRAELRSEMKDGFRKLGAKMDVLNNDLLTVRGDQRLLEKSVDDLESKVS